LASEELVVVCPPGHRLAGRQKIDPSELDGEKFVAFQGNIPTRRHIDRMLKAHRVTVDAVMEFDNIELIKRAIEVGSGLSILPRDNVEREIFHGDLASVRFTRSDQWTRPVGIVRRRGKAPGPAERMFLAILRQKP
jgi:DNA-binding transcriptional LysR family regulator